MSEIDEDIRVRRVNRYDDWNAKSMFGGFEFRVVLKHEPSFIEALNRGQKLKERLTAEAGVEDEDWFVCFGEDNDEFYLKNSMFLLSWKMKSPEDYKKWLHLVEHHTLDDEKLEQQVVDDEQVEKEAKERAEREREEKIKAAQSAQASGTMGMNMFGNPVVTAQVTPKTYTNSDNPADWEFAWMLDDISNCGNNIFCLRKINSDETVIDFDLTSHLLEQDDGFGDKSNYNGMHHTRDDVRNYLTGLGFTENPKILKDLYDWDCYTDQMIAKYHDVISGKIPLDSIKGLGWEAWYSPDGNPLLDMNPVFFLQPIGGENDQFYPFDLGEDWHNEMECHDSYEGSLKDAIKILKSMGFRYNGKHPDC